ncbi:MAG TPA: ATP-binding protein [Bryobacteraceae bacterium]|nr:ATP-binding protein [Bryobacteraceae bacterium]
MASKDPTNRRLPNDWRLRRFRIGTRLHLAFGCFVFLIFLGSSLALWYVRVIRKDVESVSMVEQRMSALLQIDNSVLSIMNQLHRSADVRQRDRFEADAARLMETFRADTGWAADILRSMAPVDQRQAAIVESLVGLLDAMPKRIESLVGLARENDWTTVHARLLNQVDRSDDVVATLVAEIDRDLVESRQRLRNEAARAELRSVEALAATGLLSLLLASWLGIAVSRSITRPLASLDAGTRELARGNFGGRLMVTGTDEFAQLGRVFNQAARQLDELYGKLRLSEARFRSLIENASEMILIVSESGRVLYTSPSTERILGGPAEQFVGQSVRDLLDVEEVPRAEAIFRNVRDTAGCTESFALRFRHRNGTFRSMEGLAANLLADPAVAGIVVNVRDVSERRRAEQVLREREDQLRQAQKMEAIGRLAGGVAHDFNNLLTVINGYSELLTGALPVGERLHGYAKDVRDAGDQAADLTRQLLAFGRKQMLDPAVLNVNDVVRETDRMLRRVIGEDIELICRLDPSIGPVEADRNQLQLVLMNLAVNARDAMPLGGRLTIETSEIAESDASVLAKPCVILKVSDTGEGMDEATQRRVFEPFFTTKGVGKGTGLGLSTVYGIVNQSGGRITVESEVDRGTTFVIHLPCTNRLPAEAPAPAVPAEGRGKETILVVEDQAEVRGFACRSLDLYGYHVLEAADAEEALRLASTTDEKIDVLLTDVVMPGMNGVELSKRLLAVRPSVKVIFASGYADSVMLHHGVAGTGAAFIPKPYGPGTLAAKIREVLGR